MESVNRCCCDLCSPRKATISIAIFWMICDVAVILPACILYILADDMQREKYVSKTEFIVGIVFVSIKLICDVLLLFGAYKEKALMLLPWIIVKTLDTIAVALGGIVYLVKAAGIIFVTCFIFYMGFSVHFLHAVYSYYKILREKPTTSEER